MSDRHDSAAELLRRFDEWRSRHPKLSGLSLDEWWAERVELGLVAHGDPSYTQEQFRIRSDDSQSLASNSGWAGGIGADATIDMEHIFRVRFAIAETTGNGANETFQFQYRKNGGTWTAVPVDGSYPASLGANRGAINEVPSAIYADGDAITVGVLGVSGTFTNGEADENGTTGNINIDASYTEIEAAFIIPRYYGTSGMQENADGDYFDIRVVRGGTGTVLNNYGTGDTNIPRITANLPSNMIGGTYAESPASLPIIENGSNWYWLIEGDETNARPVMMKSTDSGVTWNDVDILAGPTSGADMEGACWFKNGTDIIVYTQPDPTYRHVFSMSSDTWTTTDETVDASSNPLEQYVSAHRRSDGTEVCVYADTNGTVEGYRFKVRSTGGTWGSSTFVGHSTRNRYGCATVLDPDTDDVWVFSAEDNATTITLHRNIIYGSGGTSGVTAFASGLSNSTADRVPFCPPITYDDGGVRVISIAWNDGDSTQVQARTWRDGTVQTVETVASSVTLQTNALLSRQGSLDMSVSGKKRHLLFLDTSGNEYYYTSDDEGTWTSQTAPTLTAGADIPNFLRASFVNTVDLGIVYDAGDLGGSHGQIWYDEITGVGEAPGVSGTAAITEQPDSVNADGSVEITGSAAIVEQPDSVNADGTVVGSIEGSAAITEQPDTVTASGSVEITGSAAISEQPDTVTAAGSVEITGAAAITEQADTVAASGNVPFTGTAAVSEQPDTVTAAGTVEISGTAAITEQPDTVAAAGSVEITGTAAILEQPDTTAATGSVEITGTAAILEQPDAVDGNGGTGFPAIEGSAAILEQPDAVAAAGSVEITGSAAISEQPDSVAGAGTVEITGSAAITEASDVVAATGGVEITGTAAILEQPDTVVATGGAASNGTAAITEQPDTVAAAGSVEITGTAAITEQPDSVAAAGTVEITGTAAITELSDTVAATGSVSGGAQITGSAAIVEQPDTVAADGGVQITGSAAILEAGDTTTAAGGLEITGTAAILEVGDTVAASGGVEVSGTVVISEQSDTVAATGNVTTVASGSVDISEGPDTAAAVGSVEITGSAAILEQPDTVTGAGSVEITGSAAIVEAADIVEAGVPFVVITAKQFCIFWRTRAGDLVLNQFGRGQYDSFARPNEAAEKASAIFVINSGTGDQVMALVAPDWAAHSGAPIATLRDAINTRLQNSGYRSPAGLDIA